MNFVFGFGPARIGSDEGRTEIILKSLGFAAAAGVTLAIVRKAAIIVWTVIGVFIVTSRAVPNAWHRVLDRSPRDRKSTRLNSSHTVISYAVFCLKKKKDQFL